MQKFLSSVQQSDRRLYFSTSYISSLSDTILPNKFVSNYEKKLISNVNEQQLFNICNQQRMLTYQKNLINLHAHSSLYLMNRNANSCLHIASEYGSISMIKFLLNRYESNPKMLNRLNSNMDSALMHCMRTNVEYKMQKVVLLLSKYSDLMLKDKYNKRIYEIPLPGYSVSKVRMLNFLKEKYEQTLRQLSLDI